MCIYIYIHICTSCTNIPSLIFRKLLHFSYRSSGDASRLAVSPALQQSAQRFRESPVALGRRGWRIQLEIWEDLWNIFGQQIYGFQSGDHWK